MAFAFVGREEISEKIDPSLEISMPLVPNWTWTTLGQKAYLSERPSDIKNFHVYDYHCGRVFVQSETNVVYKDFKFFSVEVEVK